MPMKKTQQPARPKAPKRRNDPDGLPALLVQMEHLRSCPPDADGLHTFMPAIAVHDKLGRELYAHFAEMPVLAVNEERALLAFAQYLDNELRGRDPIRDEEWAEARNAGKL